MGVVYQSFQLLPMLTLVENILLPMDLCGLYNRTESRDRALGLLRMVELEEHANKLPNYISGGQQQRVAIARALANDPPIIIADEPTGSLDSVTADHVFEVFERLIEKGKTIIMVTHDNSLVPRFSRHLLIQDGEIIPDASPAINFSLPVHEKGNQ
jgi:putative ABC transport system ATP-binding protein